MAEHPHGEADVGVRGFGGSIWTFCALTERAERWIEESVGESEGGQFHAESRRAMEIGLAMRESGLTLVHLDEKEVSRGSV